VATCRKFREGTVTRKPSHATVRQLIRDMQSALRDGRRDRARGFAKELVKHLTVMGLLDETGVQE
jgi:hypothetical protein